MREPVPPELVDMIIDQVGSGRQTGRRGIRRPPLEGDRDWKLTIVAREALESCALVAKSWTYRSHKNLFKVVTITVDDNEEIPNLLLPSAASLKFVELLVISVAPQNLHRGPITLHLLSAFSVCPLESLRIYGGLFSLSGRPALRDCFDSLSGQLLDVSFFFCSFELEPLRDILAAENTDVNIMFFSCDQDHPEDPARNNVDWQPVYHNADRTLCVMGSDEKPSEEFLIDLSELSVQFSRLEVDFYEDGEIPDATQCLIDANAGAVSFLKVNIISNASVHPPDDSDVLSPPGLALCVNLSGLVLNMKGSYSCIVETSAAVLATLMEADCPNLSRITLEVEDAAAWSLAETRGECMASWNDLDSTLATLACRSMNARGEKLVFVLEVTRTDGAIYRAKKWLPRLLPYFNEEGSLHVHDGEDDGCDLDDYDVEDETACMGRAVLKEYEYETESDEETKEADVTKQDDGDQENQEGEGAKGSEKDEKDEKSDGGVEGDDEGEADD